MRQRRISGFLILALALLMGVLAPSQEAKAGETITILNAGTIKDVTRWYCPNEDVLTENKTLTFTDKSTKDTKFISRVVIEANNDNPDFLVMECNIKLNQLPAGEKFVLGIGLKKIETSMGDADNVEVTFTNDGGVKVAVYAYQEKGNPITIMEPKACGIAMGQTAKIRVAVTGEKLFKLSVAGKQICSKEIPVTGSGRVGFLQSGDCAAQVTGLDVKGYKYDRPENTNISEDFENGVDISKIHVVSTYESGVPLLKPSRVAVEEYEEGKHALMFVNAPEYYFTTKYQYSNFEMTFDVPYLRLAKEIVIDDKEGYFWSFGILYGLSSDAPTSWEKTDATDGIVFDRFGNVTSTKVGAFTKVLESHKFWEEFKPISVKLSVIDGNVNLGIKWSTEKQYTTIGSYTLPAGSPTGFIRFSVPTVGSGSIDNLKITNLDQNPKLIETEFKSGTASAEDAPYEPFERVYANKEVAEDKAVVPLPDSKQVMWYLLLPIALVIGGGIVGIPLIINKRKIKKVKEEKVNEA